MPTTASNKTSLTGQALWLLVAKTLGFVCGFVLPLILVRRLSVAEFGLYKQAFLVVNSAVAWLPMGFMMSAYYFLPRETPDGQKSAITNILLVYYSLGAVVWTILSFAPGLLRYLLGEANAAQLAPHASLVGLTVLFWVGSSFLEVISLAHQETRLAALFVVNAQLTKTLFLLGATLYFGTVRALLIAAVVQGALQALVLQWYLGSRFGSYWRHFDFALLQRQLIYALPLGAAGIFYYILLELHNYFVSHHVSQADFAVYSLGGFTLPLVGLIATSVSAVLIPRISQMETQAAAREVLLLTAQAMRKLGALFFPIYVFFLVLGREVIELLFRADYLGAWPILLINITLIPFLTVCGDPVLRAFAEHRYFMLKVRVVLLGLMVLALWQMTARYGMMGAAVAAVTFMCLDRAIEGAKAWRVVGGTWRDVVLLKDWLKIGFSAALAGAAATFVRLALHDARPFTKIVLAGGVLALVYGAAVLLTGTLNDTEKSLLRSYRNRAGEAIGRRKTLAA